LPATSTQISSNHFQLSSNPVQYDNKSRDWNDPTPLNQGRPQPTSTFADHAERNDPRAEAQRAAAEPSTPDPNHQNSSPKNISGSATWEPLQIRKVRRLIFTARPAYVKKSQTRYPKQGNPFFHENGPHTVFDHIDLLPLATERLQEPAHRSIMGRFIGKLPYDLRPGQADQSPDLRPNRVMPDLRPNRHQSLSYQSDPAASSQGAGPRQDLDGNQFSQTIPTNQVHGAHGNETTLAASYNFGPQVTRDFTPLKHALHATNRLGGKFASVAPCAAAKPEAAVSAADEHHPKIAQERSVPPAFTLLQRGSVGVRTMLSGSTLVNQTNQSHWFKSTKPFEPGPPSPISSVIQQSGHVHLELHDGANSQISLLPWYTCITAQYQLLPASLLYHAGKGTNVNGRQSPSLTANLEEATSINWGPPEHYSATLHRPAVQRTSKTDRDESQSNRGPAYVILASLKSGQHTQLLDSASALRFALSLFLLVATFRYSLRYASLCLCNFDFPLQVALYVSNRTNDGAIKPRKIASADNRADRLAGPCHLQAAPRPA
jgi:hypothetical protein